MRRDFGDAPGNPTPRLEARLRTRSGLFAVGPRDTLEMSALLDEVVQQLPEDVDGGTSIIEMAGMFFGSAPGITVAPTTVRRLAKARASLAVLLRTTDVGPLGRLEPPALVKDVDPTTVSVSFRARGLFEPDAFSSRVGLIPTKTSRRRIGVASWHASVPGASN